MSQSFSKALLTKTKPKNHSKVLNELINNGIEGFSNYRFSCYYYDYNNKSFDIFIINQTISAKEYFDSDIEDEYEILFYINDHSNTKMLNELFEKLSKFYEDDSDNLLILERTNHTSKVIRFK